MTYSDFADYAPLATIADAHREWHTNAGVPMGEAGCPQDACHPYEDPFYGWTDEDFAQYDAEAEAVAPEDFGDDFYVDLDPEPPF